MIEAGGSNQTIHMSGAGLVGSLLSIMLAKKGFRVRAYEKRPDMRLTEMSAGRSVNLALSNRGIFALEKAGVMDKIRPLLIPMRGRMIHDLEGKQSLQPYGQREHEVIYSVSRGDMNQILMSEAEATGKVDITFSAPLSAIDLENNWFEYGESSAREEFSILLGTDGAPSPVRAAILERKSVESREDFLEHSYKELCFPAQADGAFAIEKEALHIWPREEFMLIALPNVDGSFTVTLFLADTGPISFEALQSKEQVLSFFKKYFPDTLDLAPNLVEDFFSNPIGKLGTIRCAPWSFADKACLLGDAAHAIVPFHGQGMNCGFEDCTEFTDLLEESDDWLDLFAAFEARRKVNADAIADMALENYEIMRASVVDPIFLKKKELGFVLEREFPDKFIPRYSRVMFHLEPYAEALRIGAIQDQILTELVNSSAPFDKERVQQIIELRLS